MDRVEPELSEGAANVEVARRHVHPLGKMVYEPRGDFVRRAMDCVRRRIRLRFTRSRRRVSIRGDFRFGSMRTGSGRLLARLPPRYDVVQSVV